MIILTVNAGSSSVRLAAFRRTQTGVEKLSSRKYDLEEAPSSILKAFIDGNEIRNISAVAHRVVHGGTRLSHSCLIDSDVEAQIGELSQFAPLHNPFALKWISECRNVFSNKIPQIAVFDTAFYSMMPDVATTYALPKDLCAEWNIRRYGFHGIAHKAMSNRWKDIRPDLKEGGSAISIQLGAGCSISAVQHGKVIDTSMGFSPLEGLVMATRSGDIDPFIVLYLMRSCGLSMEETEEMLNHSSGLLGISGISGDMKILLESDHPDARIAVELFCYRVKKYIGAFYSILQGADTLLFGGGIGENSPVIRERIIEGMKWMGIVLDTSANSATIGREGCISSAESRTAAWVISVDEESILAEEADELIHQG